MTTAARGAAPLGTAPAVCWKEAPADQAGRHRREAPARGTTGIAEPVQSSPPRTALDSLFASTNACASSRVQVSDPAPLAPPVRPRDRGTKETLTIASASDLWLMMLEWRRPASWGSHACGRRHDECCASVGIMRSEYTRLFADAPPRGEPQLAPRPRYPAA